MAKTEREQLRALLEEFRNGMLVTRAADGAVHAYPMSVAKLEEDDTLLFATGIGSAKIAEIEKDPRIAVTFQSPRAYVSLSGNARIVTDRHTIDAAWSEPMRVWFPKGKDDPSLCLLAMTPSEAEFWDVEGAKGLRYVFEAARAYVTGTTPASAPDQHAKITEPSAKR